MVGLRSDAYNECAQDNPNLEGNMQKIQGERGALETLLVWQ
jgi:hypothetical protein